MTGHQHSSWADREAEKDFMSFSERGGEAAGMIGILLAVLFFYAHQAWSTGFFTSSFGQAEALALYGSIVVGGAGPVVRMVNGRRNLARPPEMFASLFWIASSIWLLQVFPFDFANLGGVLPESLRFVVGWVTNDIGWLFIALGAAGGVAFTIVNGITYVKVRSLLQRRGTR